MSPFMNILLPLPLQRASDTAAPAAAWAATFLPAALLRPGPLGMRWWQFLALIPVAAVALIAGMLAGWVLTRSLGAVARRADATWGDALLAKLRTPALVACSVAALALLLPLVALPAPVAARAYQWIRVAFGAVLFWTAWRRVDIARQAET